MLVRRLRRLHADIRAAVAPALEELRTDAKEDARARRALEALRKKYATDEGVQRAVKQIGGDVVDHNAREFRRVTGVTAPAVPLASRLEEFRKRNVSLISSIDDNLLTEVDDLLVSAYEKGQRHEVLAKRIEERFGVSESRAALIARDQTAKLNAAVTKVRQTEAGIVEYTWLSARDERVRDRHKELNGTRQRWDSPPIVDKKSGRRGHPGEDIQCRCVAVPVISDALDLAPPAAPTRDPEPEILPIVVVRSETPFLPVRPRATPTVKLSTQPDALASAEAAVAGARNAINKARGKLRTDATREELEASLAPLQEQLTTLAGYLAEYRALPAKVRALSHNQIEIIDIRNRAQAVRDRLQPITLQIEELDRQEFRRAGVDPNVNESVGEELDNVSELFVPGSDLQLFDTPRYRASQFKGGRRAISAAAKRLRTFTVGGGGAPAKARAAVERAIAELEEQLAGLDAAPDAARRVRDAVGRLRATL